MPQKMGWKLSIRNLPIQKSHWSLYVPLQFAEGIDRAHTPPESACPGWPLSFLGGEVRVGWLLRADGGVVGVSSCWPGCSSHGFFTWRSGWGQFSYSKCFPNVTLLPFVFLTFFSVLCFIAERVLEALKAMLENAFSKTSFFSPSFLGLGVLGFGDLRVWGETRQGRSKQWTPPSFDEVSSLLVTHWNKPPRLIEVFRIAVAKGAGGFSVFGHKHTICKAPLIPKRVQKPFSMQMFFQHVSPAQRLSHLKGGNRSDKRKHKAGHQ